jgi:hypothetical protein
LGLVSVELYEQKEEICGTACIKIQGHLTVEVDEIHGPKAKKGKVLLVIQSAQPLSPI